MFACLFILFKEVFQKKLSSPQNFFYHSHRHCHCPSSFFKVIVKVKKLCVFVFR